MRSRDERRRSFAEERTLVDMLPMFCLALRRRIFDRIGPLDERYGLGLFEDDDYSRRLHSAGLRLARADDVFVHHFGEGSFGRLVPSGEYSDLFERNRRRFESKWSESWTPHRRATDPAYAGLVPRGTTVGRRTVTGQRAGRSRQPRRRCARRTWSSARVAHAA